jgi:tetratricopeptide (TPR) repeat protein/transcriptional regulator with XRE-family HTH domain
MADASTAADLAEVLRLLRRRHAREQRDAPLTYRELATRTGWSHGSIGWYFTGKVLPPTDRFDTLVQILGATLAEQGVLATVRDRVEEQARIAASATPASGRPVIPRQLPGDVAAFTGRTAALVDLDGLLAIDGSGATISTVSGTAGVGKTTLAVHWAHRVADQFPDGQLYVNLRGFGPGGQEATAAEALRVFLDALGVAPQRIPVDLDSRIGLYRSLLTGRRVLIVLDNAATTDQVRPLLPGAPGCLVLVTSRNQLTGLVAAEGAHPITLDLLSTAEARQLLATRLGPARVSAAPDAVDAIITACARLPLALVIVAARGAIHPGFPLTELVGELRDVRGGLRALRGGDPATDVQAVFSWSYQRLGTEAARLFRLLDLAPGPDISVAAAASLIGTSPDHARRLLIELAHASLLAEHLPGRYTVHDLLRAYAGELARSLDTEAERDDATGRILDHYLHTGHAAALLLDPHRNPPALSPRRARVTPEQPADQTEAIAWFTAEHQVLLASLHQAAATGHDTHAWQIAWTLVDFLDRRGHWPDWVTAHTAALAAAERSNDLAGQAVTGHHLARAHIRLRHFDEAHVHLQQALDLYGQLGDHAGQARVHGNFSFIADRQAQYEETIDHLQQSLALLRTTGDEAGQGAALSNLGWSYAHLGDHEQALDYCRQALALQQRINDHPGEAYSWDSIGYIHHQLGQYDEATDCYQHALRLWRDAGDRYCESETLTHLGDLQQGAGDPTAARATWQQALAILDDLDHPEAERVRERLDAMDRPAGEA